ncbi:hypothetical protein EBZ80_20850 [bacterium]|nr:hypothetical protein [bacterium]
MDALKFKAAVDRFSTGALKQYGNHAFEAGYFNSMVQSMFQYLPDDRKAAVIDQLDRVYFDRP